MKIDLKVRIRNDDGERALIEFTAENVEIHKNKRTVDLEPAPDMSLRLSFQGEIYENGKRYPWCGGQCQDSIREHFGTQPGVERLIELWDRFHLNNMNAGTTAQSEIVAQYTAGLAKTERYDYNAACKYLKARGKMRDRGYSYGSEWLLEVLTEGDVALVMAAFAIVEAGTNL